MPHLLTICSVLLALSLARAAEETAGSGEQSLVEAVHALNQRAVDDDIGRDQLPLTPDAVVAAIRWALLPGGELEVADETRARLIEVTRSGRLPADFELEFLTRCEPDHATVFDLWLVRLRIPGGPILNGTTCITIQERLIRSRVMGPAELEVMKEWQELYSGGIGSLERGRRRAELEERRDAAMRADRRAQPPSNRRPW